MDPLCAQILPDVSVDGELHDFALDGETREDVTDVRIVYDRNDVADVALGAVVGAHFALPICGLACEFACAVSERRLGSGANRLTRRCRGRRGRTRRNRRGRGIFNNEVHQH